MPEGAANAAVTCKHVLAARLVERVMPGKVEERVMEEDMFVNTLAEMN